MLALCYGFNADCVVFATKLKPSSALTGRRSCRWEHLALASFFVEIAALDPLQTSMYSFVNCKSGAFGLWKGLFSDTERVTYLCVSIAVMPI